MEQFYHYLTGTKFRQRVDAVVEKFDDMRDDLDKDADPWGVSRPARNTNTVRARLHSRDGR